MMKLRPMLLLLVGIVLGMGLQAALAGARTVLAKEFADKVVISSGGLPHDIEISGDVCLQRALSYGNLEDPTLRFNGTPEVEGEGYLITRYMKTFTGYEPLEQVRFYHDPHGGRGYVYHIGGGASDAGVTGAWFRPTALSQFMMEYLLLNPSLYEGSS